MSAAVKATKIPEGDRTFTKNSQMEKMFYDLGGLLTVGTDPTGIGERWPVMAIMGDRIIVEADGSRLEAIKIATLNERLPWVLIKTSGRLRLENQPICLSSTATHQKRQRHSKGSVRLPKWCTVQFKETVRFSKGRVGLFEGVRVDALKSRICQGIQLEKHNYESITL